MSVPEALHSADTDNWLTSPYVFDPLHREFGFDIDLSASSGHERLPLYFTPDCTPTGALGVQWSAAAGWTGWCNPPYSDDAAFVKKAAEEARHGFTTVMLLFAKTDVKWWHDIVMRDASEVRLVRGRLCFISTTDIFNKKGALVCKAGEYGPPAPKGSAVVVFRPKVTDHPPHFSSISFPRP